MAVTAVSFISAPDRTKKLTIATPVKKNTIELATNDSASQKASKAPWEAGGRSQVEVEAP